MVLNKLYISDMGNIQYCASFLCICSFPSLNVNALLHVYAGIIRCLGLKAFTDWTVLSGVWVWKGSQTGLYYPVFGFERVHRLDCIIRCLGLKGFTDWTVLSGVWVWKGSQTGLYYPVFGFESVHRLDCIIRCLGLKAFTDWTVLSGVWCQICAFERVHRLDCIIRCLVWKRSQTGLYYPVFGVRSVRLKGFTDWTVLSGVWVWKGSQTGLYYPVFGVRSVRLKGFTDWTVLSGVWVWKGSQTGLYYPVFGFERVHRLDCIIRCLGLKGFTDWTVMMLVLSLDQTLEVEEENAPSSTCAPLSSPVRVEEGTSIRSDHVSLSMSRF